MKKPRGLKQRTIETNNIEMEKEGRIIEQKNHSKYLEHRYKNWTKQELKENVRYTTPKKLTSTNKKQTTITT